MKETLKKNQNWFTLLSVHYCTDKIISLSDSVLETKKLQAEVLNSTCRNIKDFKLLQNVNFDGLTFFDSFSLVQPIRVGMGCSATAWYSWTHP